MALKTSNQSRSPRRSQNMGLTQQPSPHGLTEIRKITIAARTALWVRRPGLESGRRNMGGHDHALRENALRCCLGRRRQRRPGVGQGLQDRLFRFLGDEPVPRDDGQRRKEGGGGVEGQGRQCRHRRHQWRRYRQGQAGLRPRRPLCAEGRRRPDLSRGQCHGHRADQDRLQLEQDTSRHHRHRRPLRQVHQPDHHRQQEGRRVGGRIYGQATAQGQ